MEIGSTAYTNGISIGYGPVSLARDSYGQITTHLLERSNHWIDLLNKYDTFTYSGEAVDASSAAGIYSNPALETNGGHLLGQIYALLYSDGTGHGGMLPQNIMDESNHAEKQLQAALDEMKTRVSNGEKVNLYDLENKITIAGTDISLGQLLDIPKMTKQLTDVDNGQYSSGGHNVTLGKIATSRQVASVYANTLGGELGKLFQNAINKELDTKQHNYETRAQYRIDKAKLEGRTRDLEAHLYSWNTEVNGAKAFSTVDTSSLAAFKSTFADAITDYKSVLKEIMREFYSDSLANSIQSHVDSLMKHFDKGTNNQTNTLYSAYSYEIRDLNQQA